jgi:hypothetical protein
MSYKTKTKISNPTISNNVATIDLLVPATAAIHTPKSEDMDLLMEHIIGPKKKDKKLRKCKFCGRLGHTKVKCPFIVLDALQTKDIISGDYIIGNKPANVCEVSMDVYLQFNKHQILEHQRKSVRKVLIKFWLVL